MHGIIVKYVTSCAQVSVTEIRRERNGDSICAPYKGTNRVVESATRHEMLASVNAE